jgi:hypothetical protein
MTIEKANDYLLEQAFPAYDIEYSKMGTVHKAYTLQSPDQKPADKLLEQTIEYFSPERLFLVPRKKNGSVSKRTAPIEIELPEGPNEQVGSLNGFSGYAGSPAGSQVPAAMPRGSSNSGFDGYKDFIIRDLEKKLDKAENKLEKQESLIEKLKEDKAELEKNVAFKDKEFELAIQEKEGEHKSSLNGIVSSLREPETLEALAGLATAIKEMRTPQAIEVGESGLPEGIESADLRNEYIYNVVLFMSRSNDQVKQKIYQMIEKAINKQKQAV